MTGQTSQTSYDGTDNADKMDRMGQRIVLVGVLGADYKGGVYGEKGDTEMEREGRDIYQARVLYDTELYMGEENHCKKNYSHFGKSAGDLYSGDRDFENREESNRSINDIDKNGMNACNSSGNHFEKKLRNRRRIMAMDSTLWSVAFLVIS